MPLELNQKSAGRSPCTAGASAEFFNPSPKEHIMARQTTRKSAGKTTRKSPRGSAKNLQQAVAKSAQKIWLAGLGAFNAAQAEGTKAFERLVKQGKEIEQMTRNIAGDQIVAVASRAGTTLDKLEKVFEQRVEKALKALGVPTARDVSQLSRRVAELSNRVEKLTGKPAPRARRAASARKAAAAA
jgi:poly(hydroxyalkanoate) granule-associated protein